MPHPDLAKDVAAVKALLTRVASEPCLCCGSDAAHPVVAPMVDGVAAFPLCPACRDREDLSARLIAALDPDHAVETASIPQQAAAWAALEDGARPSVAESIAVAGVLGRGAEVDGCPCRLCGANHAQATFWALPRAVAIVPACDSCQASPGFAPRIRARVVPGDVVAVDCRVDRLIGLIFDPADPSPAR